MTKKVIKIEPVRQQVIQNLRPKKRVCAYCRVSTDSIKQHTSYVAQLEYYEKYISKQNDWVFVGVFADEAKSGTKIKSRDEFQRMMHECESGNIDMIVTKSVTRFARNTVDSIEAIRKLKALGVTVYFEKENINSISEQSEQMLTILSSLAQGESESISTNNRWSIQKRFRDGSYNLASVAYGYMKDEDEELIINEDEAEVVRRIYQSYMNGNGVSVIARALNHESIPTPRTAAQWNESTVSEILKNRIYEGDLILQKTYTTEAIPFTRKHNRGEMPQFFIENNHEPIITRQEGEIIREILEQRRIKMGNDRSDKYKNRYAFSGKIICRECLGTFKRQKVFIGKPYESIRWCCSVHIKKSDICQMKPVREDIIEDAYLLMWNKLVSHYGYILVPMLDALKNLRINQEHEDKIIELNHKLMELTEQSHILSRIVQKGYMDSALFIQKQNELNVEIEETKRARNTLLDANGFEKEIEGTQRLIDIIRYNPEIQDSYNEKLFEHTVEQVMIGHNKRITFKLINDLELTEEMGMDGDM